MSSRRNGASQPLRKPPVTKRRAQTGVTPSNRAVRVQKQNTASRHVSRNPAPVPVSTYALRNRLVNYDGGVTGNRTVRTNLNLELHMDNQRNDEVTYLYSVDSSSSGRVVPEIDLTIESEMPDSSLISGNFIEPPKENSQKQKAGRKRKSDQSSGDSQKRPNADLVEPLCSVCDQHYDDLDKKNERLCATACGHLICETCGNGRDKLCGVCGKKVGSLRKLFL